MLSEQVARLTAALDGHVTEMHQSLVTKDYCAMVDSGTQKTLAEHGAKINLLVDAIEGRASENPLTGEVRYEGGIRSIIEDLGAHTTNGGLPAKLPDADRTRIKVAAISAVASVAVAMVALITALLEGKVTP